LRSLLNQYVSSILLQIFQKDYVSLMSIFFTQTGPNLGGLADFSLKQLFLMHKPTVAWLLLGIDRPHSGQLSA
jgi:hypothetical protein